MVSRIRNRLSTIHQVMEMCKGDRHLPLASFGLIADVHYADIDDGTNYTKTRSRYYRNSLRWVKTAVADWALLSDTKCHISLVLHLGDLIDGFNVQQKASESALKTITDAFDEAKVPVFHLWGNHDFYNFSRKELYAMPKMNPYLVAGLGHTDRIAAAAAAACGTYFDLELCHGFRLVAIDAYDISMLGHDNDSEFYQTAERLLKQENKNEDLNSPNGLVSDKRRFVKFNGAVSDDQLKWLDSVLSESDKHGEVVLVAGHCPLISYDTICLCWNYRAVLDVFYRHNCVLAYFAGHAHDRMYSRDEHGIHHFTVPGVIEVEPGAKGAHCTVALYANQVTVTDVGAGICRELFLSRV